MYQVPSRMHSSLLPACILQMDGLNGTVCCETMALCQRQQSMALFLGETQLPAHLSCSQLGCTSEGKVLRASDIAVAQLHRALSGLLQARVRDVAPAS